MHVVNVTWNYLFHWKAMSAGDRNPGAAKELIWAPQCQFTRYGNFQRRRELTRLRFSRIHCTSEDEATGNECHAIGDVPANNPGDDLEARKLWLRETALSIVDSIWQAPPLLDVVGHRCCRDTPRDKRIWRLWRRSQRRWGRWRRCPGQVVCLWEK